MSTRMVLQDGVLTEVEMTQQEIDELNAFQTQRQADMAANKDYAIYDLIPEYKNGKGNSPKEINFETALNQRLHPEHTFSFGELTKTIYYKNITDNGDGSFTYDTPIVEEEFSYTRNPITQFPTHRLQTITWYYDDGTKSNDIKLREKYYDGLSAMQELIRRRDNNVRLVLADLIPLVMSTDPTNYPTPNLVIEDGQLFFTYGDNALQRDLYIQEGNPGLIDNIRNDTNMSWMDNDITSNPYNKNGMDTIRNYIIYELSMGEETS